MVWVFLIYEIFWAFVVGLKAHFNLILFYYLFIFLIMIEWVINEFKTNK